MSVEESPEFKKALAEECERQYRGYLYGGDIPKGAVRTDARIMSDPAMREIAENLRKLHSVESGVVCPKCHETDSHGNRMNGKPFCFKCQLPMMSREKAEKWVKPVKLIDDFGKIDRVRVRK